MKKKNQVTIKKILFRSAVAVALVVLIVLAGLLSYVLVYNNKIYPNISVAGKSVAGNSQTDASLLLSKNIAAPSKINLFYQDQTFDI